MHISLVFTTLGIYPVYRLTWQTQDFLVWYLYRLCIPVTVVGGVRVGHGDSAIVIVEVQVVAVFLVVVASAQKSFKNVSTFNSQTSPSVPQST
jgi:hypothetical protein